MDNGTSYSKELRWMLKKFRFKFSRRVPLKPLVLRTPCFGSSYPQTERMPSVKIHCYNTWNTSLHDFCCYLEIVVHSINVWTISVKRRFYAKETKHIFCFKSKQQLGLWRWSKKLAFPHILLHLAFMPQYDHRSVLFLHFHCNVSTNFQSYKGSSKKYNDCLL